MKRVAETELMKRKVRDLEMTKVSNTILIIFIIVLSFNRRLVKLLKCIIKLFRYHIESQSRGDHGTESQGKILIACSTKSVNVSIAFVCGWLVT